MKPNQIYKLVPVKVVPSSQGKQPTPPVVSIPQAVPKSFPSGNYDVKLPPRDASSSITFTVNGAAVTVQNPDPRMTLNEYLRYNLNLTGTKRGCAEGGCGACTVQLTKFDPTVNGNVNISVNSCLRPLCSVDGMAITTVEGIGNTRTGLHPIQEAIADASGSQCGYCTPGMVMQMYNVLENNSTPTAQQIEDSFDGNLCRCTGFRPILSAFKSFASDGADYNTINGVHTAIPAGAAPPPPSSSSSSSSSSSCAGVCAAKGSSACANTCTDKSSANKLKHCYADIEDLPRPKPHKHISAPDKKKTVVSTDLPRSIRSTVNDVTWLQPTSLSDLFQMLGQYSSQPYMLVVGNTSTGIYKDNLPQILIHIGAIPELHFATLDSQNGATFGAAVSISQVLSYLQQWSASSSLQPYQVAPWTSLAAHIEKVAGHQVRNIASWAGNLMLAHDHSDFPSDLATILYAANATLSIASSAGTQVVDIGTFLQLEMTGLVITSIQIPFGTPNQVFRTFKAMQRFENSHAYVNAGFSVTLASDNSIASNPSPVVVFGGAYGKATRVTALENALVGQSASSQSVFQSLLSILANIPIDPTPGHVAYRTSLVQTLFYKFFLCLQPNLSAPLAITTTPPPRPISDGVQSFQSSASSYPLTEPVPKQEAYAQAAGELKYTCDLPSASNQLWAAIVPSTESNATIVSIDTSAALAWPGVVAVYTANDLTPQQNAFGVMVPLIPADEEIFASQQVCYYGQSVALVVADTQRHADEAAKLVNVTYSNIQPPILTWQDAVNANSFFNFPSAITGSPLVYGNVAQGFANSTNIITGTIETGMQAHFHLEAQGVLAEPSVNGGIPGITLTGGTQWTTLVQQNVAAVLGIPMSSVVVNATRIGGSYGARITRNVPFSIATAIAAFKLNKPVRMFMNFNTNQQLIGKRIGYAVQYKIGTTAAGLIQAIELTAYLNQGSGADGCPFEIGVFFDSLDNSYLIPNLSATAVLCKTNLPPNTSVRGPGWTQGIFVSEQMLEHIAASLGQPPEAIRLLNMYDDVIMTHADVITYKPGQSTPFGQKLTSFTVPQLWQQIKFSAEYDSRVQQIVNFNQQNRWVKRGISINPIRWGFSGAGSTYSASVSIYGDGSVLIQHSGVEIGQGINTKTAQVAAMVFGIPLSTISVQTASTNSQPNTAPTGGSATNGFCAAAVGLACNTLVSRLAYIKKKQGAAATWLSIITEAVSDGVDLTARGMEIGPPGNFGPQQYEVYGVAITEVEVDLLTGSIQIPRADVLFDAGQSMNPALDIGQVEGAFMMGIGYHTSENTQYDSDGSMISDGTWEYKIPSHKDIPIDLRVTLVKNSPNPYGMMRAKAAGEPALSLSCSVLFAIKHAIAAGQQSIHNNSNYFVLNSPATVENIQTTFAPTAADFVLSC